MGNDLTVECYDPNEDSWTMVTLKYFNFRNYLQSHTYLSYQLTLKLLVLKVFFKLFQIYCLIKPIDTETIIMRFTS